MDEVQVGNDVDPASGLEMYREIDYFIGGIKEPKITVWYYQWLKSPNGARLEEVRKKYVTIDVAAVMGMRDITDAEGNVTGQEEYEVTPEFLGYSIWRSRLIPAQWVGAKLGDDIIIGAIKATLAGMPFDVIDGHVTY